MDIRGRSPDGSLDRFERDFLRRLDEQFAAMIFAAVVAIFGTSLCVGLILIASFLL